MNSDIARALRTWTPEMLVNLLDYIDLEHLKDKPLIEIVGEYNKIE